jgi:hypothetical protein
VVPQNSKWDSHFRLSCDCKPGLFVLTRLKSATSPLESALTQNAPITRLESALTKNTGVGGCLPSPFGEASGTAPVQDTDQRFSRRTPLRHPPSVQKAKDTKTVHLHFVYYWDIVPLLRCGAGIPWRKRSGHAHEIRRSLALHQSRLRMRSAVEHGGSEGGKNPRCSCGAAMKKRYLSPALTYLDFLHIEEIPNVAVREK